MHRRDAHPRRVHLQTLLADHLALGALQAVEPTVEAGESLVLPMELDAPPLQEAGLGQCRGLVGGAEIDVQRGDSELTRHRRQAPDQRRARLLALGQQAQAGDRRERYGRQQLGIVAAARPAIALGPAMIEHVLAVGMALHVERCCRHQAVAVLDDQVEGLPAGLVAHRLAGLERMQEGVAQERIAARDQRVPGTGVDGGDPGDRAGLQCRRGGRPHGLSAARTCPRPRPPRRTAGWARRPPPGHAGRPRPAPPPSGPKHR